MKVGAKISLNHQTMVLCQGNDPVKIPRVSPLAIFVGYLSPLRHPGYHGCWSRGDAVELYMKQTPTTEASLEEYRKASPAALLRGLRKKEKHLFTLQYFFLGNHI